MASRSMVVALLAAAVLAAGCREEPQLKVEPTTPEPPRDGVVVHISHGPDDPHRVLMGLQMAVMMVAEHDVAVYCDIDAIGVVLADAEDLGYSHFPSSQTQLAKLAELGVPVYACPGCLKAADKGPEDLAEGIRVASTEAFFSFTDGRILTLDY